MRAVLRCGVAAAILFGTLPAAAQSLVDRVKRLQSDEGEAELPDIDAIERGARAPASLSFGRAPGPAASPRSQSGGRIEGAAAGLAPPGGLYGVDATAMEAGGEPEHAGPLPEHHTVQKGETLSALCAFYFGDPFCWPKLWAGNPIVTNPHWIFPGDVLRLRAPGADPAPAPPAGTMRRPASASAPVANPGVLLREVGFIEAGALDGSAVVSGSREEKIMLASGDQAYVSFTKDRPLRAGERYSVFVADKENPVRDPVSGGVLGYMVRVYGDLVVDQIAERNTARGTLQDLVDPVERGYKVSPHVRQFKRIEPRPSAVSVESRVVASFSPTQMLAPETFVVLSRGRKDGLEVGNRTFVVRRGDGHRGILEGWEASDPRFPKELVAELWIVDVRENAAVAWIARSVKEVRVGETTESRKGH